MPQCQNCKAEVSPDFKFCKQCGSPLKASVETKAPEAPRPEPSGSRVLQSEAQESRQRTKGGRARWLIPLVVILGVGAGIFYFGGDTIRAYLPGGGPSKPPLKADQHLNQGMTYASMKDYDNAILEFTKAIEVDPKYAIAYANRGVAYIQQRKFNKAMDDLKKAEELNPKDKMVRYNLVALYSLQNQRDRALDALDKALELGFNDYDALRNDPDLANVRRDPEFRKVLEKHKVFLK